MLYRSLVIDMRLLVSAIQLAAYREDNVSERVLDGNGGHVVSSGLAGIRENPIRRCTRCAVEPAGTRADVRVENVRRMAGVDARIFKTECRDQCLQVETVSGPIDFEPVRHIRSVAMQLESVRYAGTVTFKHAAAARHSTWK